MTELTQEELQVELVAEAEKGLRAYIFNFYPESKQAEDRGWEAFSSTLLRSKGFKNLDEVLVQAVEKRLKGSTHTEALGEFKTNPHFVKLYKIALRLQWTYMCIKTFKTAVANGTYEDITYPKFPDLKGL